MGRRSGRFSNYVLFVQKSREHVDIKVSACESFFAHVSSSIDVVCTSEDTCRTDSLQSVQSLLNSGRKLWYVRVWNASFQFRCNKVSRGSETKGELACAMMVSASLMIGSVSGVVSRDASSLRCG